MTTTIKASTAADMLGYLPSLLNYIPTESLVILPMVDGRTAGAMRFDIDVLLEDPSSASTAIDLAARVGGVAGIIVAAYADRPSNDQSMAVLFEHVSSLASNADLHLHDLLFVASDGYTSLAHPSPRPLTDIIVDPTLPLGKGTHPSALIPDVNERQAREVREEHEQVTQADDPNWAIVLIAAVAFTNPDPDPLTLATMSHVLDRPSSRDVSIITWAGGEALGYEAVVAQTDWESGEEYPRHLASIMWGEGHRPDAALLERVAKNVQTLAAILPTAGTFATLAWINWALGRSSSAEVHAKSAQAIEPEHGLAGIIISFIDAGHLPEWAFEGRA